MIARSGDTLAVVRLDRLGRSSKRTRRALITAIQHTPPLSNRRSRWNVLGKRRHGKLSKKTISGGDVVANLASGRDTSRSSW
jgi:hypothetical protein